MTEFDGTYISDIRIRYHGPVPGSENLSARVLNQIKREAWEEAGHYWHAHLRPKHFTKAGAREYGYAPRKGEEGGTGKRFWRSYTGRKQRQKGHTLPLVWSGELRELSKIYKLQATATSTRSRLRVILPAAQKANWRNPYSRIDMAGELTRVSDAEAVELVGVFDRFLAGGLEEVQTTQTKTIK